VVRDESLADAATLVVVGVIVCVAEPVVSSAPAPTAAELAPLTKLPLTPITVLPVRLGKVKVVVPSPTPKVVPHIAKRAA
jgi:hypothetical protein